MCKRLGFGTEFEPEYVFQLEDIDSFWQALESYLGTNLRRTHSNVSKAKERYKWSTRNVEQVSQHFSKDIEKFGFDYVPMTK